MPLSKFNESTLRQILQQFCETSFNSILITSAEEGYPILYANSNFCQMTGYSLEELHGQTPKIFQGEKTNPDVLKRLKESIEAGQSFHGAAINYRKNREAYPVEWNITPIKDHDDKVTHFMSIQKYLSNLKQVVSQLKKTNENFRKFLLDISRSVDNREEEVIQKLIANKQYLTVDLLENAKIYTKSLRSNENSILFEDSEFYDCSNDLNGMLSDNIEYEPLTAADYINRYGENRDISELLNRIRETQQKIDLLPYSTSTCNDMKDIGHLIQEVANDIFYFEDFVEISSVLGELASHTKSHAELPLVPIVIDTYNALMNDLELWATTNFIDKNATNVHALDASIISSAKQLKAFVGLILPDAAN